MSEEEKKTTWSMYYGGAKEIKQDYCCLTLKKRGLLINGMQGHLQP